ncbi:hypothetical protein DL93DRAFT_497849 [Clavulina sp. PMI_390]|nr:hypothetical protein DL93DRAFT_497849 [Clavulina sp. PMI_390]
MPSMPSKPSSSLRAIIICTNSSGTTYLNRVVLALSSPLMYQRPSFLGPSLVGTILSTILFGVITIQTKLYFRRFPKDFWVIKIMVALLWCAQCIQVAVASQGFYQTTTNAETVETRQAWDANQWATHLHITAAVVQIYFAGRLWTVPKYRIYIVVLDFLTLVKAGLGIGLAQAFDSTSQLPSSDELAAFIVSTSFLVAIDVTTVVAVTLVLRSQRTGFLRTDRVLNCITLYVAATGALTSIIAILMLIFTVIGESDFSLVTSIPFGGVYIASALAHLHSRASFRAQLAGEDRLHTGALSSLHIHSPSRQVR